MAKATITMPLIVNSELNLGVSLLPPKPLKAAGPGYTLQVLAPLRAFRCYPSRGVFNVDWCFSITNEMRLE